MRSPQCETAVRQHAAGQRAVAIGWHSACRDRSCGCLHHRQERMPLEQLLNQQTRRKLVAAGIDPDASDTKDRNFCLHEHDLTVPDALNSRGECRECRRESAHQYKQRIREANLQRRLRLAMPGIVVSALPQLWLPAPRPLGRVVLELPPRRYSPGRRIAV